MSEVKIKIEKPPIYENACAAFMINPKTVIFTYGDTIYNPSNLNLTDDLIAHEQVHIEQQKGNDKDAELWWGKYLREPEFRISQELEAYAKQYNYICKYKTQNKQTRFTMLRIFSKILSGGLYGECVSFGRAMQLIREEAKKYEPSIH